MMAPRGLAALLSAALAALCACGGSGDGAVMADGPLAAAANVSVSWSITEGSRGGSISTGGLYTAPSATGTYHVVVTSRGDPSQVATATVTVTGTTPPPPPPPPPPIPTPTVDCATAPLRTTGTVHYVCDCQSGASSGCAAGNDSNAGTSPSAPKQTLGAALSLFNGMNAGETVALCRGGAWSGTVGTIANTRCTAANPCDFRDYAPSWGAGASNPRPIIQGGSGTVFNIDNNGTQGGMRFWNLDSRTTGTHFFAYNTVHDVDICGNKLTGGYAAIDWEPEGYTPSGTTIRGNDIQGATFAGFFGGSPGISITGNSFSGNGTGNGNGYHSVYLISHCPTQGYSPYCGSMENSTNSPDASVPTEYVFANNHVVEGTYCLGPVLVVHGVFINNHLRIENNLIETTSTNPGCYGMMLSGGNSGAYFGNATISRNRFFAPGNAAEVSCCVDCTVTDNVSGGPGDFVISDSSCSGAGAPSRGTYQNNTVYGGQIRIGGAGAGPYNLDSNAVWTNDSSCISGSTAGGRSTANYCRASGGASATAVFKDPNNSTNASRDFSPSASSPLLGAGSTSYYAPTAIGSGIWSPSDAGVPRTSPIDAGAY